jgi:hypothetical protein
VLHPRRDPVRRDDDPRLVAAQDREDGVVVPRVDVGVRLRLLRRRLELRQLRSECGQQPEGERSEAQDAEDGGEGEKSELADPAALWAAASFP